MNNNETKINTRNNSKIHLTSKDLKKFLNFMKRDKESGGVIDFDLGHKGEIKHLTDERGGNNYQISLSLGTKDYEAIYHTHHYKARCKGIPTYKIVKKIHNMIDEDKTWDALYYFESDIIRIHPPSPPDCISAFKICHYHNKYISFVFTEEGIYTIRPTKKLIKKYINLKPEKRNIFLNNLLKELDKKYFRIIWGTGKNVTKWLENDDSPKIKKLIKTVENYTNSTTDLKRIRKYMNVIREKGFKISYLKWSTKTPINNFFKRSVV